MVESEILSLVPALRRFARALTGDMGQADDLVQDCLERALSRLSLWRRGSNLRAWLFTIMRNLWLDELRCRGQRADLSPLDAAEGAATAPSQEANLAVRDLISALALLSPEQRETVLLVGLEGMSYAEVAEITKVPMGTVMSRLARGRQRLAQLMQGGTTMLRRVK